MSGNQGVQKKLILIYFSILFTMLGCNKVDISINAFLDESGRTLLLSNLKTIVGKICYSEVNVLVADSNGLLVPVREDENCLAQTVTLEQHFLEQNRFVAKINGLKLKSLPAVKSPQDMMKFSVRFVGKNDCSFTFESGVSTEEKNGKIKSATISLIALPFPKITCNNGLEKSAKIDNTKRYNGNTIKKSELQSIKSEQSFDVIGQ